MNASPGLGRRLQGRWLLVAAPGESWRRLRQHLNAVVEFVKRGKYRVVLEPKSARAKALFSGCPDFHRTGVYRVEHGLLVQRFGAFEVRSRVQARGNDELVLERVGVGIRGSWLMDDTELGDCTLVLRRGST